MSEDGQNVRDAKREGGADVRSSGARPGELRRVARLTKGAYARGL